MLRLTASARSHIGKVRSKNEDNLCMNDQILPENKENECILTHRSRTTGFFGVFDGMGGYAAGERASFVMAQLAQQICGEKVYEPVQRLLKLCDDANLAVCQQMRDYDGSRMGTTASMLYFQKRTFTLCNIGDSPIFLYRNGRLTQIHQEHTERATYEAVTGRPADPKKKFRLTQNIGMFPDEIVIEPYCVQGKVLPGDIFLICSDGITDMVQPPQIIEVLRTQSTADAITKELVTLALDAGGKDNATVICVCVETGWLSRLCR